MFIVEKNKPKNKFGQYFTPEIVANFMIDLAEITQDSTILEPSCGEGVFLKCLQNKGFTHITAYEIDNDLAKNFDCVKYESFVSANITEKYDLIIGNPPYIRWKNLEETLKNELLNHLLWNKYFNSLCDYLYIFILKSIELLKDKGQLIFICPEYWMNTTHADSLRNYMVMNGYFEEIYHFNETPIFEKVTVSIVIFKFVKTKQTEPTIKVAKFYAQQKLTAEMLQALKNKSYLKEAEYLTVSPFQLNSRWLLASDETQLALNALEKACKKKNQHEALDLFKENLEEYDRIGDYCDIGNGLVSGLDKAFQLNGHILSEKEQKATLKVIKAKDLQPFFSKNITKYIFITENLQEEEIQKEYPYFWQQFQAYKEALEKRYQYKNKSNYWEWAFLRNFKLFSKNEKRIFVPCKERISNKNYFRFAWVEGGIYPTQDVTAIFKKPTTKESIAYILAYLNHQKVFDWLICKGIVKGNIVEFSEKPISSIPFKAIDWANENEVKIHDSITKKTMQYLESKQDTYLIEINFLLNQLLNNPKW